MNKVEDSLGDKISIKKTSNTLDLDNTKMPWGQRRNPNDADFFLDSNFCFASWPQSMEWELNPQAEASVTTGKNPMAKLLLELVADLGIIHMVLLLHVGRM